MSVREEMRGYLFSSPRITHSIKPVAEAVHPVCLPSKSVSKLYGEESEAGGGLDFSWSQAVPCGFCHRTRPATLRFETTRLLLVTQQPQIGKIVLRFLKTK